MTRVLKHKLVYIRRPSVFFIEAFQSPVVTHASRCHPVTRIRDEKGRLHCEEKDDYEVRGHNE